MINSRITKFSVSVAAVAVLAVGVYGLSTGKRNSGLSLEYTPSPESVACDSIASPEAVTGIPRFSYTNNYSNSRFGFSLKHPADFKVTEFPNEKGGETIIIQNPKTQIGVQIVVAPNQGQNIDITEELVRAEIPDMKISAGEKVVIDGGGKGLAFISDNEAFGGASREVWFVFRGNVYQISTYAEFDEFLKGIFGTWKF